MTKWENNLIDDAVGIRDVLRQTKSIAVVGIKTEQQADQPAFSVPRYLQGAGYDIYPVPVYYPEVTVILGRPVHRKLVDIPEPIDMVNLFRRPKDIPQHLDDILAKRPKFVWMQLGIRHDEVARKLAEAGIRVVQDHCLLVEHKRLM